MPGKVEVTINIDGTMELEAHGFRGKGCEKVNRMLADAVGKIEDDGKKPEWSMPEPSKSTVSHKENGNS